PKTNEFGIFLKSLGFLISANLFHKYNKLPKLKIPGSSEIYQIHSFSDERSNAGYDRFTSPSSPESYRWSDTIRSGNWIGLCGRSFPPADDRLRSEPAPCTA